MQNNQKSFKSFEESIDLHIDVKNHKCIPAGDNYSIVSGDSIMNLINKMFDETANNSGSTWINDGSNNFIQFNPSDWWNGDPNFYNNLPSVTLYSSTSANNSSFASIQSQITNMAANFDNSWNLANFPAVFSHSAKDIFIAANKDEVMRIFGNITSALSISQDFNDAFEIAINNGDISTGIYKFGKGLITAGLVLAGAEYYLLCFSLATLMTDGAGHILESSN